jgi:glutamate carboxypeptidase
MPLTAQESKLCRAIQQRERALLDDLRLHVSLATGGNNAPALDETRERLAARLMALGARVELVPGDPAPDWLFGAPPAVHVPPTAICRFAPAGAAPGRGALIAGHLDTVHDPRGSFRDLGIAPDGKSASGPGCVDMKGGLVIAIHALEAIHETDGAPGLAWTVLLNSDEETGSYHSDRAIRAEAASGRYTAGLALEPATPDGGLVIERGGSGQFMIETLGKAAHVGRDFASGVSAVAALADAILRVDRISDPGRGLIANIGPIQGGHATNIVPDQARAWGNVRFASTGDGDELARELDSLATAGDQLPRTTVRRSFNRPAKPFTPGTQRLAELARGAATDLGLSLPFSKTAGVCDGNLMQDAGLPTIDTLGVRGGGLHTAQEWIEIASLVERCQLLALLLVRLSNSER